MAFRCTFFWVQQGDLLAGWGMSFYNNLASLTAVKAQCDALFPLLNQCTGANNYIPRYRISLAGAFRQTLNVKTGLSGGGAVTPSNQSTYAAVDVQIKLTAPFMLGVTYNVTEWLRGVRGAALGPAGAWTPSGPYASNFTALFAALTTVANGWCLNVLNKATVPTYGIGVNQTTGVISAPGHGVPVNGKPYRIRLKGCGFHHYLNNLWWVIAPDANSLQIQQWTAPAIIIPITGKNPSVTLQTYVNPSIATVQTGITSSHKTGRPTGLLGGRRRTRLFPAGPSPAA